MREKTASLSEVRRISLTSTLVISHKSKPILHLSRICGEIILDLEAILHLRWSVWKIELAMMRKMMLFSNFLALLIHCSFLPLSPRT